MCSCFTMLRYFLLYNKVNQLYVQIFLLPLELSSHHPHTSPLSLHRALRCDPCAIEQLPTSYFIHGSTYICQSYSSNSSHPSLLPAVSTCLFSMSGLYSCPENRFICTIFLDSIYICVNIIFIFLFLINSFTYIYTILKSDEIRTM